MVSEMANKNRKNKWKIIMYICLIVYLLILAYFLFIAEYMGRKSQIEYHYNLVLFKEIRRFLANIDILGVRAVSVNILGNIGAFVPLGFLLPATFKKLRKLVITVALSCLISTFIETLQLIIRVGIFDIDDIFLNTLGAAIGYYVFRLLIRILAGRKNGEKTG